MNIHRILFSLFLLFALLAAFLFFPSRAVLIAGAILMISLGFSIFAILRRQVRHYRAGQIGRGTLMRNSTVEIGAMFLVLGLSILLGRIAMGYILGWISGLWGSTLGMLAAMICGLTMSLLVQSTWGRLVKRPLRG